MFLYYFYVKAIFCVEKCEIIYYNEFKSLQNLVSLTKYWNGDLMFYDAQLRFLRATLKKYHISTLLTSPNDLIDDNVDMGLRKLLGIKENGKRYCDFFEFKENTVYKLCDTFMCRYILFLLPKCPSPTLFIIGPYLTADLTREQILEKAEVGGVPPRDITELENYINDIPLVTEEISVHALVDTFCECIWGNDFNYTIKDINKENAAAFSELSFKDGETSSKDREWNIQLMEKRYEFENELMQAVSQGQTHKAQIFLTNINTQFFEKRVTDSLRNIKNYCIIMNTLLRKAAERGGVHPVYLDSISSMFAQKIENLSSTDKTSEFMAEIFRAYCKLVKKYSINKYSAVIQKTIIYIDNDLTANLTLSTLAKMNNVSASYLSSLFKNETGETLTDFVNKRRVKLAKNLLKTTNLQIQTIAQHCGILDVHYFSKIFKKYEGLTPKAFRDKK